MSTDLHVGLAWLPRPPADFAAQCRGSLAPPAGLGERLRRLATHGLDENGLARFARVIARARADGLPLAPLVPFRLGILGNATTELLVPALVATAARHGIALDCVAAEHGQVMQAALDPDFVVNRARPDAVLVALDHRGLPLHACPGDAAAAEATVAQTLEQLAAIRAGIRRHSGATAILQTLARPPEPLFGSLDFALPGTLRSLIEAVNRGLATQLADGADLLFDVAGLAETVGLAEWHDPRMWNLARLPFAGALLPLYAEHLMRQVAALRGKSRRVLVLDLDNTVWGGVIGDDGLDGIRLAEGDPVGEADLAVQRAALALRGRGVLLAVSSKNLDETARLPFRQHPEMLLREEHIAVFQANWTDKAGNLRAIAGELNLGLDALVLLDDNPAERALVRRLLPEVAVPELPEDPALFARTLAAAGYFEAIAFSPEDRARAEFYRDNARRAALLEESGGIDAYLESLRMEIEFRPFDEIGRTRIAQLVNKSNQFNLTTRRYTEAEIAAAERDPEALTLQVRLTDSFGDNGMISAVICRRRGRDWEIDTWLMSCRVLGRSVEQAVLQELLDRARDAGIERLVGLYRPSGRNGLVERHYAKLGFSPGGEHADGGTEWTLVVAGAPRRSLPMTVRRPAAARAAA